MYSPFSALFAVPPVLDLAFFCFSDPLEALLNGDVFASQLVEEEVPEEAVDTEAVLQGPDEPLVGEGTVALLAIDDLKLSPLVIDSLNYEP